MKKRFLIAAVCFVAGFAIGKAVITYGNWDWFDTKYTLNRVHIRLDDFTVDGKVTSWRDYSDSDVVQVTIGKTTYLTSYENVVLILDPEDRG